MIDNALESAPSIQRMGGFSLIEALISFVIIAVGMLALAIFHSASLESNADSKARTEAVNLAQARLEALRSLRDETVFQTTLASGTGSDTAAGNHANFARSWTVTRFTPSDRAMVDVTVGWADATGVTQSVKLRSVIAEVNPHQTGRYYVAMIGVPGTPVP